MIDNLLRSQSLGRALQYLNDMHRSTCDFAIHDPPSCEAMEEMNISAAYNRLRREIIPVATPWHQGEGDDWGHPYTLWTSMICGDYHAGYCGYLLSEVYAADIFDSFFKSNPEDVSQGRRYRHVLLEQGRSRPEMETLLAFLGREPDPRPFYRTLGIV